MPEQIIISEFSVKAIEWAAEVLREQFEEVFNLRDDASRTEDIEGVHKMRVAIRRLRSSLRDFSPYLKKRPLRQSKKDLKRLADALGAVRDKDVEIAALEKLYGKLEKEVVRKYLKKLIAENRTARERALPLLIAMLESSEIEKLHFQFPAAINESVKKSGKFCELTVKQAGREIILNNLREFYSLSDSFYKPFDCENLHRLRIAAKRLRYAVELFDAAWNKELTDFAEEISAMQNFLGELHDADLWIEKLSRRLCKAKDKKRRSELWLMSRFVRRRTENFRSALSLWSKWQKNDFIENLGKVLNDPVKIET